MDNRSENDIDKNDKSYFDKNINGKNIAIKITMLRSWVIKEKRNNYNAFYNKSKKKKHMSNQLCEPMRSHNTFSMEQMKFQQYL